MGGKKESMSENKLYEFITNEKVNEICRKSGVKRGLLKRNHYFASGKATAAYFLKLAIEEGKSVELVDKDVEGELKTNLNNLKASRALQSKMIYHPELLDYQRAGVDWILGHRFTLLADEMGLGKTIQAIVAMDFSELNNWMVVCPSSLKYNWRLECERWFRKKSETAVTVVEKGNKELKLENKRNVFILSYDILRSFVIRSQLNHLQIDGFIADEAHYLKSGKAERTKVFLNYAKKAKKCIAITGTPIVNRPIELYPMLKQLSSDTIMPFTQKYDYGRRFCAAFQSKWGWDDSGSSREEELAFRLRSTCMIRRSKKEVLPMLPLKFHKIIALEPDKKAKILLKKEKSYDIENLIKNPELGTFGELAEIRKELAETKLKSSVEYIRALLEETEKVVVFCYHREIIAKLEEGLLARNPAIIHGGVASKNRQLAVEKFQNQSSCRVFIGQINASGVGLTLTKSSNVVFVEMDWSPSITDQCIDRCHRLGQQDNVTAHYIVVEGSLDEYMIRKNIEKRDIINEILK